MTSCVRIKTPLTQLDFFFLFKNFIFSFLGSSFLVKIESLYDSNVYYFFYEQFFLETFINFSKNVHLN